MIMALSNRALLNDKIGEERHEFMIIWEEMEVVWDLYWYFTAELLIDFFLWYHLIKIIRTSF